MHDKIDKFCAESRIPKDGTSYNFILKADPSHLIRMAVGVGFRRARLRYAYMLMRGKNLETGVVTKEDSKTDFQYEFAISIITEVQERFNTNLLLK